MYKINNIYEKIEILMLNKYLTILKNYVFEGQEWYYIFLTILML